MNYPITNKEKEILSLVSSGLTTKEIAGRLKISKYTVETHRKNLLRKCQAKNSAELIHKSLMVEKTMLVEASPTSALS
jgi:two-component system, NarL family, response regulator NreC